MQRTIAGSYGIAVYCKGTHSAGAVQQPKEDKSKGGKSLKALADGARTLHNPHALRLGTVATVSAQGHQRATPSRTDGSVSSVRVCRQLSSLLRAPPSALLEAYSSVPRPSGASHPRSLGAVRAAAMLPVVWLCGCAGGVRGSVAAAELSDADAPFVADGLLKAAL
jgi:hypothetical protein